METKLIDRIIFLTAMALIAPLAAVDWLYYELKRIVRQGIEWFERHYATNRRMLGTGQQEVDQLHTD
ncbi:MAG: hypothetical protein JW829_00200 [Pirellulales bacterium]|nr:hypothetical protein [Pirellulales bacterium]